MEVIKMINSKLTRNQKNSIDEILNGLGKYVKHIINADKTQDMFYLHALFTGFKSNEEISEIIRMGIETTEKLNV